MLYRVFLWMNRRWAINVKRGSALQCCLLREQQLLGLATRVYASAHDVNPETIEWRADGEAIKIIAGLIRPEFELLDRAMDLVQRQSRQILRLHFSEYEGIGL